MPTQSTIQKPSRVSRARNRLEIAIERLEAAVRQRALGADAAPTTPADTDLAALRDQLRSLKEENGNLRDTHRQISARVDSAVLRLKDIVEE